MLGWTIIALKIIIISTIIIINLFYPSLSPCLCQSSLKIKVKVIIIIKLLQAHTINEARCKNKLILQTSCLDPLPLFYQSKWQFWHLCSIAQEQWSLFETLSSSWAAKINVQEELDFMKLRYANASRTQALSKKGRIPVTYYQLECLNFMQKSNFGCKLVLA